jgi:hypothetical protein
MVGWDLAHMVRTIVVHLPNPRATIHHLARPMVGWDLVQDHLTQWARPLGQVPEDLTIHSILPHRATLCTLAQAYQGQVMLGQIGITRPHCSSAAPTAAPAASASCMWASAAAAPFCTRLVLWDLAQ